MSKTQQIPEITGLRTLASSSVAVTHAFTMLLAAGYMAPAHFTARGAWFFFILSGFLYRRPQSPRAYGNYLRKRLARLLPLHLAVLMVYVVGAFAIGGTSTPSVGEVLANALLVQEWATPAAPSIHVPTWSLSVEMFFVVVAPLVLALMHGVRRRATRLVGKFIDRLEPNTGHVAMLVLSLLLLTALSPLAIPRAIRDVPFFMVGMAAAQISKTGRWRNTTPAVSIAVAAITVTGLSALWSSQVTPLGFAAARLTVALGYATILLNVSRVSRRRTPITKLLSSSTMTRCGAASYSYYLIHTATLTTLGLALTAVQPPSIVAYALTVVVLLATWALAQVVHRRFEIPAAQKLTSSVN